MDPNQTLAELIDAATDGNDDLVLRAAFNLEGWLKNGGFAPNLRDVLAILTVKG